MDPGPNAALLASVRASPAPDATRPLDVGALRGRLVRFALKLVWNRDDAEEIVQEAFRVAFALPSRPPDAVLERWTLRTVANLAMNLRRRRRPEPLGAWIDPPATGSPQADAERVEALERLREAIDRLPDRQRLALVMRTMEQMDYETIAATMELSVAAVRTHVHLARRRLAELMGERRGRETTA